MPPQIFLLPPNHATLAPGLGNSLKSASCAKLFEFDKMPCWDEQPSTVVFFITKDSAIRNWKGLFNSTVNWLIEVEAYQCLFYAQWKIIIKIS